VRDGLVDLVEGKGSAGIVRYCPDDLTRMKISLGSGSYTLVPESLDVLEDGLEDVRLVFNGEQIDVTQENISIEGDSAHLSMTFVVSDQSWEQTLPARVDLERAGDRWVIRGLHVFD
jgi:hypothetical protein